MAGWLMAMWLGHRAGVDERAKALVRIWLDRGAAAYDYAARLPAGSPTIANMQQEALQTVSLFGKAIEHSGLADDYLWIDWSIICQRIAQEGPRDQAVLWHQRAKAALASVTIGGRNSDYYQVASGVVHGTPLTVQQETLLHQWRDAEPASWSLGFMEWTRNKLPYASVSAVDASGYQAYSRFHAAIQYHHFIYGLAALLAIPGWLCLRKPFLRRKRSERLQKLWPLAPTLCLLFGTTLLVLLGTRYLADFLRGAAFWHTFVRSAGPGWAGAVWNLVFVASLCCVPWAAKVGLSAGWGSTWQVLGIEWKDFMQPRLLLIGIATGCVAVSVITVLKPLLAFHGWGSPMWDIASRWPFSDIPGSDFFMLVFIVVLGPVIEEVTFRGYLFASLRQRFSPALAIWITAALFSAGHAYSLPGTLSVFFGGAILGWVRLRTGRLAASILTHATINALAYVDLSLINF